MASESAAQPACPITSRSVRYGVAVLLLVFYIHGFLRGGEWYGWALFGVLLIPAAIGLMATTRAVPRAARPRVEDVALALAATCLVAAGVRFADMPPVLAASLMGVVAACVSMLHSRVAAAAVPLYCGAFAGMTSELVLAGWPAVAVSGLLAGLLVSLLRASWDGVGGKLGLLAFGGVYLTAWATRALGTYGGGAPVLELDRADRVALVVVAPVAAFVTLALRRRGVAPVLASAAPSAVFTLVLFVLDDHGLVGDLLPLSFTPLCVAWFGGSFIGMTAPGRVGDRLWPLLVAAALFGVLQVTFKPAIAGYGGDFGASAVVAVLVMIGLIELVRVVGLRTAEPPAPAS
ncbi:MAG: hypothetical protein ACR2J9_01880 [Gaiellales bacterium]